jgi:hypothetical protein
MSDPTAGTVLSAAHLARAVLPVGAGPPEDALRLELARVTAAVELGDAVRARLTRFPPPPRSETLPELVQAARRRLREDRVRVDAEELGSRRLVLDRVLAELTP